MESPLILKPAVSSLGLLAGEEPKRNVVGGSFDGRTDTGQDLRHQSQGYIIASFQSSVLPGYIVATLDNPSVPIIASFQGSHPSGTRPASSSRKTALMKKSHGVRQARTSGLPVLRGVREDASDREEL